MLRKGLVRRMLLMALLTPVWAVACLLASFAGAGEWLTDELGGWVVRKTPVAPKRGQEL
jgi:hypothetical protein